MPTPPSFNQYYAPPQQPQMNFPQMNAPDVRASPQTQMMDQPLALYHPNFYPFQQQSPPNQIQPPPAQVHTQLNLTTQSSPSSGSDYVGTPPADGPSARGKRPASAADDHKKKKAKKGDDDDGEGQPGEKEEVRVKATRGSRACTVCRRLKMKCVGAENGGPCKRCQAGNHECIFEESNRGKRSSKKHEQLTRSLRKMEKTLDTVLKSINQPGLSSLAEAMMSGSRTPSPTAAPSTSTGALMRTPSPGPSSLAGPSGSNLPQKHETGHTSPKLHSLPDNILNPLGLLAEASLANRRTRLTSESRSMPPPGGLEEDKNPDVGVASESFFKPGPMTILPLRRLFIERQVQPEMLTFVPTEEVVDLFTIYFERMNMHCNLLDPDFHTPSLVCSRSPFLLTAICAIASKFYDKRPDLHPRLTELAKTLAFSVPEKGFKSVEIVQAYLLLTLWGCGPVARYEQDKTWLLLGMGIRTATDLNLHRKVTVTDVHTPAGQQRAKEIRNRERAWLMCYCLDRSLSMQLGKPHTIKEDAIIQSITFWWQDPLAIPTDAGICAYVDLQRILSRSLDLLYSGLQMHSEVHMHMDYYLIIRSMEEQINSWGRDWAPKGIVDESAPFVPYRRLIAQFYYHYAMLMINSFGLQNALQHSSVNMSHFFARCHSSAMSCATLVRDELAPKEYLKYSPDGHFVQFSYSMLSLLKLLRPEFHATGADEQKTFELVKNVADVLEGIAVGPMHTPALYSTFLRALVTSRSEGSTRGPDSPIDPEAKATGAGAGAGAQGDAPTHWDEMADAAAVNGNGSAQHASGSSDEHQHQQHQQQHQGIPGGGDVSAAFAGDLPGLPDFQFTGEMGPVADMSTFPPTMAPLDHPGDDMSSMLSMDSIFSSNFWDNVLVPGYSNSLEGISGGFVYGAGGTGLITPGFNTPSHSGYGTPAADSHMGLGRASVAFDSPEAPVKATS